MIADNSRAARMRGRLNRLRMAGIVAMDADAEQGRLGFFGLTKRRFRERPKRSLGTRLSGFSFRVFHFFRGFFCSLRALREPQIDLVKGSPNRLTSIPI